MLEILMVLFMLPGLLDAGIGVYHAGDEGRHENDHGLAQQADAEQRDHNGDPRDAGNGLYQVEQRTQKAVHRFEPRHTDAQRDADDHAQQIPAQHGLQAGGNVHQHGGPLRFGIVEFFDKCFYNTKRTGQHRFREHMQAVCHEPPDAEKDNDG